MRDDSLPSRPAAIPFARDDEHASGQDASARVHQDAAQERTFDSVCSEPRAGRSEFKGLVVQF